MLWRYRQAKLVITTRIHVALPCVARGVPVIFVQHHGINEQGDVRTDGLTQLFHVLNLETQGESDAQIWINNFNFEHPPPNPNLSKKIHFCAHVNLFVSRFQSDKSLILFR